MGGILFITAVIAALLIYKGTRSIMTKILIWTASMILSMISTFFIGKLIFKDTEMSVVLCVFTFFELVLIMALFFIIKDFSRVRRLKKHGLRTTGTITYSFRGSGYHISYKVNGKIYECLGNTLTQKYKKGDEVTVVFSEQNPSEACLEKGDYASSIAILFAYALLLIGAIVTEYYFFMNLK